jgi:predicted DNA-binding protein
MNVFIEHALDVAAETVQRYTRLQQEVQATLEFIDLVNPGSPAADYDNILRDLLRHTRAFSRAATDRRFVKSLQVRIPNQTEEESKALSAAIARSTAMFEVIMPLIVEMGERCAARPDLNELTARMSVAFGFDHETGEPL